MLIYALSGWWAVLVVLVGFVAVMWLCRRFPNQLGMGLWAKQRDDEPDTPDEDQRRGS
jgi:hypothetical protein